MNKVRKYFMWILSVLSYAGIIIVYPGLPNQIPIHWNVEWEIDNMADKKYIFLLGLLPFVILVIFDDYIRYRHGMDSNKKHTKVKNILKAITVLLMIILNWITIAAAYRVNINLKLIMPVAIGIVFILIGNYMPAIKSNFFMGIRNPWTLTDDTVWRKTHKLGGYMFIIIGLLMVVMGLVQSNMINMVVFILLIIGVIGINLYSYMIYRNIKRKN